MKSIICRAYHKKEKKWYWFDVMWGDEHGNMWMLPEKGERRHGKLDNRIRVDPLGWEIYVELSAYMPTHLDLDVNDEHCCGIFNAMDDNGNVKCNECGMSIYDAIQRYKKGSIK